MTETREEKLKNAIRVKDTLAKLLQSGTVLTTQEFDKACELYAKAVIIVARLT